jgi:hypothetical protein
MTAAPSNLQGDHVDVRIGIIQNPKELEVHLGDDADPSALRAEIDKALADGGALWLTDRKGRQVAVPAEKVAYVEIGSPEDGRRIGFG